MLLEFLPDVLASACLNSVYVSASGRRRGVRLAEPVVSIDSSTMSCCPILQVKNFGRRGRTKHTHLVDQDTTVFDDDLAPERALQDAYFKRVAGVSQTFVKPKTLPINEKRHIAAKDKRATDSTSSRAAYLKSNY